MSDPGTPLDISPFVNAVARLREGLDRHRREPDGDQLRDGLDAATLFSVAASRPSRNWSPSGSRRCRSSPSRSLATAFTNGLMSSGVPGSLMHSFGRQLLGLLRRLQLLGLRL